MLGAMMTDLCILQKEVNLDFSLDDFKKFDPSLRNSIHLIPFGTPLGVFRRGIRRAIDYVKWMFLLGCLFLTRSLVMLSKPLYAYVVGISLSS